jgi:hypothetical protein
MKKTGTILLICGIIGLILSIVMDKLFDLPKTLIIISMIIDLFIVCIGANLVVKSPNYIGDPKDD